MRIRLRSLANGGGRARALPDRAGLTPWIVVGAVWVTLAIASGLYFSFPVFFVALV
jgi:hypothetical protein